MQRREKLTCMAGGLIGGRIYAADRIVNVSSVNDPGALFAFM